MNITSKVVLDSRSTKKDGTHPLKLLIVIGRKPLRISLGYSILAKDWNEKSQAVKSSCKSIQNTTRFNSFLQKEKARALDILTQLQVSGEIAQLDLKEIKSRITGIGDETLLIEFCNTIIKEMEQAKKVGNARVYKTMRNSVQTFLRGKDISLKLITYKWLKKYEAWYMGRGNSVNGLSVNMRTLRALINRAIRRQLLSKEAYPFENYSVKNEKTKKRAISQADIEKVIQFVPRTQRETRAKDYFLMSFYLMGASFIDLAFLKVSDLKNGRVEYKRRKTSKLHSIKITPPLQTLLDKYLDGKSGDDFILNVIKSKEVKKQYINARDELRRYNRSLKEIGEACGIEHPLTSYVARHSFATIAKFKDVPVPVISQALGHSNVEITEVYLAEFDNDVMDKYNEIIIGG